MTWTESNVITLRVFVYFLYELVAKLVNRTQAIGHGVPYKGCYDSFETFFNSCDRYHLSLLTRRKTLEAQKRSTTRRLPHETNIPNFRDISKHFCLLLFFLEKTEFLRKEINFRSASLDSSMVYSCG